MRQRFITNDNNSRLILFFAGWGADHDMFRSLRRNGYDIMLVYDYTDSDFDTKILEDYEEIVVIAWSMGVFFADKLLKNHLSSLPVTKVVAVNGTLSPIDDLYGIPTDIFLKTMELPDQRALDKFFRRICGGSAAMKELLPSAPSRDVENLRKELQAIYHHVSECNQTADSSRWDEIIISGIDLIFPPDNMQRAWANDSIRITRLDNAHHLIDFQKAINILFADKSLIETRFGTASETYDSAAEVQMIVANRTASLIEATLPCRNGLNVLELGSGSGLLSAHLQSLLSDSSITFRDFIPHEYLKLNGNVNIYSPCDAELAMLHDEPSTYDLIASSSTIQWFHSPRQTLKAIVKALRPGGVAVISYFGKGTFQAIADIISLRYPIVDASFIEHLGCDCQIEHQDIDIDYPSAAEALRSLRATGVNALSSTPLPVSATREIMRRISNPDNTATLTYSAVYIIIRKSL